jgi:hypothetical protein
MSAADGNVPGAPANSGPGLVLATKSDDITVPSVSANFSMKKFFFF